MTRAEAISAAITKLNQAGVPGAERDARLLYRWAAGLTGAGLQAGLTDLAGVEELTRFHAAIAARAARCPVSHITGSREFWGRSFLVTPNVLDPRPETELLVAEALTLQPRRILDLGTGSGCILLSLLADLPGATGVGLDISQPALAVAARNAERLGLSDRVAFHQSSWHEMPDGPFDAIVSNPPYLSAPEMAELQPELRHEPALALSPGGDGLDAYRAIIPAAAKALAPGGAVLLEIGATQGPRVMGLLAQEGFAERKKLADLDGRDRVVVGRNATNS